MAFWPTLYQTRLPTEDLNAAVVPISSLNPVLGFEIVQDGFVLVFVYKTSSAAVMFHCWLAIEVCANPSIVWNPNGIVPISLAELLFPNAAKVNNTSAFGAFVGVTAPVKNVADELSATRLDEFPSVAVWCEISAIAIQPTESLPDQFTVHDALDAALKVYLINISKLRLPVRLAAVEYVLLWLSVIDKLEDAPIPKKKTSRVLPAVTLDRNATLPDVAFTSWLVLWIMMPCNPSAVEFPATGFQTGCELPDVPGVYATSKFPLESTMVSSKVAVPP